MVDFGFWILDFGLFSLRDESDLEDGQQHRDDDEHHDQPHHHDQAWLQETRQHAKGSIGLPFVAGGDFQQRLLQRPGLFADRHHVAHKEWKVPTRRQGLGEALASLDEFFDAQDRLPQEGIRDGGAGDF